METYPLGTSENKCASNVRSVHHHREAFREYIRVIRMRNWKIDCLAIVAGGVTLAAVVRPFQNTPFIDDWCYGWPVQHLLETGQLQIPEYSTNPAIIQVLWGSLFCLPFGFSFTALRISTWTLWIVMLCGIYFFVRELGGSRRHALLGAATVAMYPTCFVLAGTFMTDVPFLAALTWSAWLFARALRHRAALLVWSAALVGCAAIGVRLTGTAILGAMFMTLMLHTGSWGRRGRVLLAPLIGLPFTWALLVCVRAHVLVSADMSLVPNAPQNRIAYLQYAIQNLPTVLPVTLIFVITAVGVGLMPIALAGLNRRIGTRTALVFLFLLSAWGAGTYCGLRFWIPLSVGEIWSVDEFGMTALLVPGWQSTVPFPRWAQVITTSAGLLCASALVTATSRRRLTESEMFIGWLCGGLIALAALLWLFSYDRYGLPFVLLAAAVILAGNPPLRPYVAIPAIVLYGVICIVGIRDHLAYNRALWTAVAHLQAWGIPSAEINGGYVVNGWLQYLHPEQAHRDQHGRISIPWVNDKLELTYTIANAPRTDAAVIEILPYSGWLRPSGRLYVLRRLVPIR